MSDAPQTHQRISHTSATDGGIALAGILNNVVINAGECEHARLMYKIETIKLNLVSSKPPTETLLYGPFSTGSRFR